jgi:hypothetical protein
VSTLYRVFPFLADAPASQPGGPLYIPMPGAGRLDNPDLFSVLYLGDSAAGAIAEAFGRFPEWTPAILEGAPGLPRSVRAIARYGLDTRVALCDLDDARQLLALDLRPSHVVTRDYGQTRKWARRIYGQHRWGGVRWWSYYDARWASIGLWDIQGLTVEEVLPLTLETLALEEASRLIVRRILAPTGHRKKR